MTTQVRQVARMMTLEELSFYCKIGVGCLIAILIGQWINGVSNPLEAIPGALIIFVILIITMQIKHWLPRIPLPTFAYASIIGLLLTMPYNPIGSIVGDYVNKIGFLDSCVPMLAVCGLVIAKSPELFKKLSWKIIVVGLLLFFLTYLGSSLIAEGVFKLEGII